MAYYRIDIKELGQHSFAILSDGNNFFIPGDKNDCTFDEEFDSWSTGYYRAPDFSLGTGWMFDKDGIEGVKRMFKQYEVGFIEIAIEKVTLNIPS